MAGSFEVHGDGTVTVAFTYTATVERIERTISDALHHIYPHHYGDLYDEDGVLIPFEELTAQQKLNILDAWLKKSVFDMAQEHHAQHAGTAAVADSRATAKDRYF